MLDIQQEQVNFHYISLLAHQEVGPNSFITDLQAVTNIHYVLDKFSITSLKTMKFTSYKLFEESKNLHFQEFC